MESPSGFHGVVLMCHELVVSLFIYFTLCFAHPDDRNVMYLKCNLTVIVVKVWIVCQKGFYIKSINEELFMLQLYCFALVKISYFVPSRPPLLVQPFI